MVNRPHADSKKFRDACSLVSEDAERIVSGASRWAIITCLLLVVALFFVFTYNSGYGYDALEYLVIGRALAHGQPFYSMIPSKSPGIYYMVAAFLKSGIRMNHYTVSALITSFFAAALIGTWLSVGRLLGDKVAIVSTLLVAGCAAFMEMNFLEPEIVVLLSGLVAVVLVLRSDGLSKRRPVFAAGIILALGFQFKAVAAFYAVGIFCFMLFKQLRPGHQDVHNLLGGGAFLVAGFLAGSIPPVAFFAATGRLTEFWTWTISFPLFHYPSNTFWLDKLYTKLLWFHLTLILSFFCSIAIVHVRRTVWTSDAAALAFFMGLVSYFALFKTQSSHYYFPGAGFFSIFIAVVLVTFWKTKAAVIAVPRGIAFASPVVLLALALSAILYEPKVFWRFTEWQTFQQEELIGSQVRKFAGGGRGLFLRNGSFLYWVSGVEPESRFVSFDVQATYFVERDPNSLLNALNDQSTGIVEFNAADPGFEDAHFVESANRTRLLAEFMSRLEKQFRPAEFNLPPFHFWVRKARTEK